MCAPVAHDAAQREAVAAQWLERQGVREALNTRGVEMARLDSAWEPLVAREAKTTGGTLTIGADGRLTALKDVTPDAWAARIAQLLPGASVEIVREDGEEIGGVVVLHAARRPKPSPRDPQRELEPLSFDAIIGESAIIESFISTLRKKVDATTPRLIHTVRGVGYTIREP